MPIKDILTVLDLAGDQPAAKYALEFGRNYDAHVTGLAVSFEPVGSNSPKPLTPMLAASKLLATMRFTTDCARAVESSQFEG